MKKIFWFSLLLVVGCASTPAERAVEKRLEKQVDGNIMAKGHNAFLNAPGLTDIEKNKLVEIHSRTFTEAAQIKQEIAKAKAALFESLTDQKASKDELGILKKKITKLDQRRLDLMFSSLDEVQEILGKNPEAREYYRENIMRDLHGYGL